MVWSHSRLTTFEDCPYKFLLSYIDPQPDEPLFFSQYGSLVHNLLADMYLGKVNASSLALMYLNSFKSSVPPSSPSMTVWQKYFSQGLAAVKKPFAPGGDILSVERKFNFEIEGVPFVGFADLIFRDNEHGLCIMDHKSRDLKPRSRRSKPTKSDELLDKYFRQLYLYAAAMEFEDHVLPDTLCFNCFRTGIQIFEPFKASRLDDAKSWAARQVSEIMAESDWQPSCEYFKCKYICGFHGSCAYYQMSGGDKS